jgi:hypothetical protein
MDACIVPVLAGTFVFIKKLFLLLQLPENETPELLSAQVPWSYGTLPTCQPYGMELPEKLCVIAHW